MKKSDSIILTRMQEEIVQADRIEVNKEGVIIFSWFARGPHKLNAIQTIEPWGYRYPQQK